jgi:enamine deaminase RidA (YjgF/YER057c/UK114 family)
LPGLGRQRQKAEKKGERMSELVSDPDIHRWGVTRRWSDAVVYQGTAHVVEVADDATQDFHGQVRQVLNQLDHRLKQVGSDRRRLLQVLIYVTDLTHVPELNAQWEAWLPEGTAPARACVQVVLSPGYLIELVATAAVLPSKT